MKMPLRAAVGAGAAVGARAAVRTAAAAGGPPACSHGTGVHTGPAGLDVAFLAGTTDHQQVVPVNRGRRRGGPRCG
ncbi:hypothetical protein [Georgenia yuyongxinii]